VNRPHPKAPSGWTGQAGRAEARPTEPSSMAAAAPGVLLYRCRLCGDLESVPTADAANAVQYELATRRLARPHHCGPGQVGVADLIGGKADDAPTEEPK
jgi:hypothetical protein